MDSRQLRELAKLGAEQELQQMNARTEQILALFPDLTTAAANGQRRTKLKAMARATGRVRESRSWTKEQRAAVSRRMRRYWRERKAAGQ